MKLFISGAALVILNPFAAQAKGRATASDFVIDSFSGHRQRPFTEHSTYARRTASDFAIDTFSCNRQRPPAGLDPRVYWDPVRRRYLMR